MTSVKRVVAIAVAALGLVSAQVNAQDGWQCWQEASNRYAVPIDLLYAVARVETGNRGNIISKKNANGTYDIGLMQINSMHLPRLKRLGITQQMLLQDPCLNLNVGASIMAESIARHGYNWRGIGAYNAGNDTLRKIYARKVISMYDKIEKERRSLIKMASFSSQDGDNP